MSALKIFFHEEEAISDCRINDWDFVYFKINDSNPIWFIGIILPENLPRRVKTLIIESFLRKLRNIYSIDIIMNKIRDNNNKNQKHEIWDNDPYFQENYDFYGRKICSFSLPVPDDEETVKMFLKRIETPLEKGANTNYRVYNP